MVAAFATPLLAGTDEIMGINAATSRTERIAIAPSGFFKQVKGFIIRHSENLHQGH
jgi:hypothetical protein